MRLVECYIENFGKWSDVSFSFEPGCQVICQENGWGKSTLATFIKVMLYGFQDEKVRDDYRNERKRYRPWQGGVYGGRLEFQAGGQSYVITRVFGSREKEDRFSLRQKDTNLVSHAYSAAVGEELFQLDCNSFCRTVFLSQNDCVTSVTDKIHAKIGNLSRMTDDMSNYEQAIQKLQERLNQMTPHRKTGSLSRMKSEMGRLEESVRAGSRVNQAMGQVQELLHQKMQEQEHLKQEQAALLDRQQAVSAYRDVQARQERYAGLCREYAARKEKLEQEKAYFPGPVPDLDKVDAYLARSARLSAAREAVRLLQLTETEQQRSTALTQMFGGTIPDAQEFLAQEERIRQTREIDLEAARNSFTAQEAAQFRAYTRQFAAGVPDPDQLDGILADWRRRLELKSTLEQKKADMEELRGCRQADGDSPQIRQGTGKGRLKAGILVIGGFLLAVLGAVIWLWVKQAVPGIGLGVAGVLASLFGIGWQYFAGRQSARPGQGRELLWEDPAWERMEQEMAEDAIWIGNVEQDTESFLAEYGLTGSEEETLDLLYGLKADVRAYGLLRKKAEGTQARKLEEEKRFLTGEVTAFLRRFSGEYMPGRPGETEADILDRCLGEVRECSREYALLRKKQEEFCRAEKGYQNMVSRLQEYIENMGLAPEPDLHAQLLEVRHHRQQIQIWEQELEKAGGQKAAFEETEDLEEILGAKPLADPDSLGAIQSHLEEVTGQLEGVYASLAEYSRQVDRLREEADQVAEEEEDLAIVRASYQEEYRKYELLKHTRFYLEQARVSFTSRYTEPVRKGFWKYYGMLAGEGAMDYHIDANANVTVDAMGMQRDPRFLSYGYQDLVGICMRMALVDAMYREEKPFIIFDDPFASLDEDKMEKAKEFLDAIGREYQVLYFTCHGSRAGRKRETL